MSSSYTSRLFALTTLPLALGLAGCFDMDVTINGQEGVPLSELDMSGAAPTEIVLAASDDVVITKGDTLSIEVEGSEEAKAAVRFVRDGDLLGITRDEALWDDDDKATIRVTMPAPSEAVITGSGNITADALAENSQVSILGSGSFSGADAELTSLDINIGGSGSVTAAGTTERLELNLGGSGSANLSALKADDAEISIAGSGSVSLQSDGKVEANIMGSGSVKVTGTAKCTENAMGSGSLVCSG